MEIQSNDVEIDFLEIETNEAIKCGEIISFDYSEFWYSCSFCQKQIAINSLEFLKHIREEFGKDLQEFNPSTNTISSDQNPIDETEIVKFEQESIENHAEWKYLTDSENLMKDESRKKIPLKININENNDEQEIAIKIEQDEVYLEIDGIQSNDKKIMCTECPENIRNESALSNHMKKEFCNLDRKKNLRESVLNIEKCNQCKKIFKTKKGFNAHNCVSLIPTRNRIDSTGQYVCNVCDGKFEKAFQLRMHKINSHSGDLTCEICGKTFATKRYYDTHKEDVHTDVTYTCDKCDKIFKKRSLLKDHVMRDHLKKYQCSICSKTFLSITQVRAHETIHGAKKAFQCDECGKSFPRYFQLGLHKKSHANLREYECDICHKRCNTDRGLRNHKQWHKEARDFVCQICFKAFKTSGCLRKHKRIHLPNGNFKCDVCGKLFNQNCNLKVHLKLHNVAGSESS